MEETTVQDPDQTVGQTPKRVVMAFATLAEGVVVAARATRASTTFLVPDAFVMGAVPA